MTGYDVLKRASVLLRNSGAVELNGTAELSSQGIEIINQISADLKADGISLLSQQLNITPAKEEALCYGAAMLLALCGGDSGRNKLFAEIYNAKRGTALAETATVADRLPTVTVG